MNIEQIGVSIKEMRNNMGLSQEVLAQKSGVAIKSIHSIEQGKANPSLNTLNKLLQILSLDLIIITKKN